MSGYPNDPGQQTGPDDGPRPFEAMPPVQPYAPGPVVVPDPPQSVRRAAMILYINAAFGVLGAIVGFLTRSSVEDALRESATTPFTEDEIAAAATLSITVGAVVSIGFAVLYFVCARKMLEARNWARIVPTVLIGLGVVFGVVGLAAGGSGWSLVSQLIGLVLGIAFLVFAWSKDATQFFAVRRMPR